MKPYSFTRAHKLEFQSIPKTSQFISFVARYHTLQQQIWPPYGPYQHHVDWLLLCLGFRREKTFPQVTAPIFPISVISPDFAISGVQVQGRFFSSRCTIGTILVHIRPPLLWRVLMVPSRLSFSSSNVELGSFIPSHLKTDFGFPVKLGRLSIGYKQSIRY